MASKEIQRYGASWPPEMSALDIELDCIRLGGRWTESWGKCGLGLFTHFKNAQTLLWPEDDHHRWSDLVLRSIVENDVTVIMGPSDASKTYGMVRWALTDWWSDPENTLHLISSTDVRGLELRVWGKMKELLNRAKELYEDLPGQVLESKYSITPDKIQIGNERGRLLQRGLICIPCIVGGRYVGLGRFAGIKQKRLRHIGDEVSFMQASFLDAYSNWYGKGDFKGIMAGNPLDPFDPLGKAAEPKEGWSAMPVPTKTTTWRSRFFDAMVVNLVGTDSPNFDYPANEPVKYEYLIGPKKLQMVAKTYGKDSISWSAQCEGVMRPGLVGKRVITRELCRIHNAHDKAIWNGTNRTLLYAADPAYGGGDRCVGGVIEFGESSEGKPILRVHEPEIIPVSIKLAETPEDQIAQYIKNRSEDLGIGADSIFYDSFGKGTLGYAFARLFGHSTPVPVDSGAKPTKRPVRYDLWVEEDGERRLKRCDEHYSKFVTEMWFSVREIIEGNQMRELPEEVMNEGCLREFCIVMGNRYEVEPKEDTKARMGCSPDLFDFAAIGCEGARRKGFKIIRLGIESDQEESAPDEQADEYGAIIQSCLLTR